MSQEKTSERRPSNRKPKHLTKQILIRLTPEAYLALQKAADLSFSSPVVWARHKLLKEIAKATGSRLRGIVKSRAGSDRTEVST